MFEQTTRLAEKLASSVSRRGFLGSLGSRGGYGRGRHPDRHRDRAGGFC
jgi:hypothetical protein